jgi:serine/threonine protein kinase
MTDSNQQDSDYELPSLGRDIPKKVGRHTIFHELGRGNMGVVLLGIDPYIDRLVAIKIPRPSDNILHRGSRTFYQDFFREARSAGRLVQPNIVAIYDADVTEDSCYLAMEHIDGPTLKNFCRKDALLPVDKVIDIILNACKALDYAHNKGVVHWDIKPANIMLNSAGVVKITDFGIARMTHEARAEAMEEKECEISGTFSYMSPQHITEPNNVDGRSDIFSLGCVMYELLTGQMAFNGDNIYTVAYRIAHEEPVSILTIRPELPEVLDKIVKKALAKDPDLRYQTGMEFAYDLDVALRRLNIARKELAVEDIADYVHHTPFFEAFSKEQVKEILSASSIIRVLKGNIVVAEGEIDDSLYIILSGKVDVLKGEERIDSIDRGECFGEMAYLSGKPRAATLRAATDCVLMKISAVLMDGVASNVQLLFMNSFALTLVNRISINHKLILSLLRKEPEDRSQKKRNKRWKTKEGDRRQETEDRKEKSE